MSTQPTPHVDLVVDGGTATVVLRGEFDVSDGDALRAVLARASAAAPNLVVDLGAVEFIDWTAFAVLLGAANHVRRLGGQAVLANPRPQVRRLLSLVRVDHLLAG